MRIPEKNIFNQRFTLITILFFLVLYSSISIVNHLLYRTYALDLGLYNNAIYDYAHGRFNDSAVFKENAEDLLSDHFDLFLILISPLSYIFGNYSLLIVQIIFLLLGGVGVYYFLRQRNVTESWSRAGMLFFYLHFSVFTALAFDYHDNVIAACIVPWLFYNIERRKIFNSLLILFLILITKENMSLWMTFASLGLFLTYRRNKEYRFLMLFILISACYFFVVTGFIMPSFSNTHEFGQFKYSVLGKNYSEAFMTIFAQPGKVAQALFYNTSGLLSGDFLKSESWIFFLLSGGIVLLFRPLWLLMLIPIFLQKFLNDQQQMWGINDQYSIEFAPVLAMGIFSFNIKNISRGINKFYPIVMIILVTVCTLRAMDRTSSRIERSNIRFYQKQHWISPLDKKHLDEAIKIIPPDSIVSAEDELVPHLSMRDKIYTMPNIRDASYVIYQKGHASWPADEKEMDLLTDSLESCGKWKVVYSEGEVRLLIRIVL
jgi:uncharacterized membrane protein